MQHDVRGAHAVAVALERAIGEPMSSVTRVVHMLWRSRTCVLYGVVRMLCRHRTRVRHGTVIAPPPNVCPAWCGGCGFVTKPAMRELRKRLTACLW